MADNKVDSNITGLAIAEELSPKTLPGTPLWFAMEPNSYPDFGGELTTIAREPLNPSRQRAKGVVSDLSASGGFNSDLTLSNLTRQLQGFFFADARQLPSTIPHTNTPAPVTATSTTAYTSTGLSSFASGMLLKASGFTNAANNGIKNVSASTATTVTVSETLVAETPPTTAKIEAVGYVFAAANCNITMSGNIPTLTSAAKDFTTLPNLIPGAWVYLGDDTAANRFANNVGYARIKTVTATALTFDDTTWTPVAETGTGKTIRLYVGTLIRNEKTPALIKRRTYQLERQLGNDGVGIQSEYVTGALPNELTINIPQAEKLNIDLGFVGMNNEQRSGTTGIKAGTRYAAPAEPAFNTSSDIYRMKMSVLDATTSAPTPLFGYVSEMTLSINNNASPNKAVGVLGAFDVSVGNFEVSGSTTAYFSTVAATQAVRNNADVGLSVIGARTNYGFVFDLPLISLGGGKLSVEKDQPVTVPLETNAAESAFGYTMQAEFFPYLPTIAMPV